MDYEGDGRCLVLLNVCTSPRSRDLAPIRYLCRLAAFRPMPGLGPPLNEEEVILVLWSPRVDAGVPHDFFRLLLF